MPGTINLTLSCRICGVYDVTLTGANQVCDDCKEDCPGGCGRRIPTDALAKLGGRCYYCQPDSAERS